MTPVEHDHRLCDLSRTCFAAQGVVDRVARGDYSGRRHCEIAQYRQAFSALDVARQALRDHEAGYTGWSRFYLVTSSSGHVHSSTRCCTCHKGKLPTSFALVPTLSGKTEAEAVAELGPALCSVCFPSAPAEHREQVTVSQAQAKILAEKGVEAFQAARQAASAKASKRCPGSGLAPKSRERFGVRCSCCGHVYRETRHGSLPSHNRTEYVIGRDGSSKYLGPAGWGPRTRATVYADRDEAVAESACWRDAVVRVS